MSEAQAFLLGGGGPAGGRAGGLGWWWHTTEDTLDKIDPAHLERDVRIYVEVVGRLATEVILPFDPSSAIREVLEALDEIEPLWSGLPSGPDDAPGLAELRDDLATAAGAAGGLAAQIASWDGDEETGTRINSQLLEACKLLIPINYTTGDAFEHDLALGAIPLPSLRPSKPVVAMNDDEQWGAGHKLRRDINRVRASIRAATAIMKG